MIPSESNSERLTRKRLIDPRLKAAGWSIVPFLPGKPLANYDSCAIEEFETANGPADYALCAEGRIIGIVEAKKLTLGPQSVLTQAERYCKGIENSPFNYRGFRVPFLYSTNGEVIWHHDIRHELCRSHIVTEFPVTFSGKKFERTPRRKVSGSPEKRVEVGRHSESCPT